MNLSTATEEYLILPIIVGGKKNGAEIVQI